MVEKVVIGNAELWLGDCRDVLPLLGPVDEAASAYVAAEKEYFGEFASSLRQA